ncbi:MAG: RNA 2',3'-cyclic phosphodiesterase [Alphaproteobacteria bacterium]|nr:RNA 2',3'-cyclic phosphodiesterase [Alphaproteobacteria bacterium]
MLRLFVGIDLPEEIKEELYSLRGGLYGAQWHTKERLNLNLRFIGNVSEPVAEDVLKELRYIRFPAFHMAFKEIGYFAYGDQPHHIWTGVDTPKLIGELQEKIDKAVINAGAGNADKFKFVPHVSLAKLTGTTMAEVFEYIGRNNLFHSKPFLVDSFCLFASHARENGEGKYYTIEETYSLNLTETLDSPLYTK